MVDGTHFEQALAVGRLKIRALDDDGHRVPDVDNAEKENQLGALHHKGQRRNDAAEEHAAGVAHKGLGRVPVPAQEAQHAA